MVDLDRWYKAKRSGTCKACVEVFHQVGGATLVRDSKDPDGPRLRFTFEHWRNAIAALKGEGLTLEDAVAVEHQENGNTLMWHREDPMGPVLSFTLPEWDAFLDGVVSGEFDRDYLTPQDGRVHARQSVLA
ncbi:DUF397 domain-containing protein [Kineosporia rhizophila]|uniref:DUF397 domain-containing protein n=1 Tax=Kineosporia rhizophila TaxID=84633 RepID=UPI000AB96B76|nr:DUF397 domain-containing protein [Kineosporia rhizophila]MCE0540723.1 DUF397 domain-containing protein [Kineosporia rhizophila]